MPTATRVTLDALCSTSADPERPAALVEQPASAPPGSYFVEVVYADGTREAHAWQVIR